MNKIKEIYKITSTLHGILWFVLLVAFIYSAITWLFFEYNGAYIWWAILAYASILITKDVCKKIIERRKKQQRL